MKYGMQGNVLSLTIPPRSNLYNTYQSYHYILPTIEEMVLKLLSASNTYKSLDLKSESISL